MSGLLVATKEDDLTNFKSWWLSNRYFNPICMTNVADEHGMILYRENEYQVELFMMEPNSTIVPHIHPNVDSYEVYLCGDIRFMCNDIWYENNTLYSDIRILPNSWHGGEFGANGGAFLSVQKWLNGVEPKFVGDDWVGKDGSEKYE